MDVDGLDGRDGFSRTASSLDMRENLCDQLWQGELSGLSWVCTLPWAHWFDREIIRNHNNSGKKDKWFTSYHSYFPLALEMPIHSPTNGIQGDINEFSSQPVSSYITALVKRLPTTVAHTLWCLLAKVLIIAMKVTGEDRKILNLL